VTLWTFREAARELETSEATIRGLVRAHRIVTLPVPRSPQGKGLTPEHMAVLRRALGKDKARPRAAVSA
jgi:hypothetical protein